MIEKPENIAIVTFVVSTVFIVLSTVIFAAPGVSYSEELVLLTFALLSGLYAVDLFLRKAVHFIALLPLHVVSVLAIRHFIGYRYPLVDLMVTAAFIMNVSLRLPSRVAVPVETVVVVSPAVFASTGVPTAVVATIFAIQSLCVLFCTVVVRYREALVGALSRVEAQNAALDNLSAANESFLRHLPEMKEQSAEQERLRITRELHDSLGYAMTNIVMLMNAAHYLFRQDPEKVRDYCLKTKELASVTMEETRTTLYKLRALGRATPRNPALFFAKLCRDFQEATGVETECHAGNLDRRLPERVFDALFRTVQVGFINALKHGKAARIRLYLWASDQDLRMTIWNSIEDPDFDAKSMAEGIGLKGVRERFVDLDGEVVISRPPDGFNLIVIIPRKELYDVRDEGPDC